MLKSLNPQDGLITWWEVLPPTQMAVFHLSVGPQAAECWDIESAFCRDTRISASRGSFQANIDCWSQPGAFGPIVTLGDRLGVPVVFDAEDYHRGEFPEHSKEAKETALLEEELLPKVTAMTASPLIAKAYASQFHRKDIVTVNNAFPRKYIAPEPTPITTTSNSELCGFRKSSVQTEG